MLIWQSLEIGRPGKLAALLEPYARLKLETETLETETNDVVVKSKQLC
jgi:hypothetical protein